MLFAILLQPPSLSADEACCVDAEGGGTEGYALSPGLDTLRRDEFDNTNRRTLGAAVFGWLSISWMKDMHSGQIRAEARAHGVRCCRSCVCSGRARHRPPACAAVDAPCSVQPLWLSSETLHLPLPPVSLVNSSMTPSTRPPPSFLSALAAQAHQQTDAHTHAHRELKTVADFVGSSRRLPIPPLSPSQASHLPQTGDSTKTCHTRRANTRTPAMSRRRG